MKRVTIIDDNLANLKIFKRFLDDKYEVETYSSGTQFIECLPNLKALPDVVVLDVMMPQMSGYEVSRLLKTSEKYNHIKVFICTALNSEVDLEKAKAALADEFIVKPVKYKDLHYFIEQHSA